MSTTIAAISTPQGEGGIGTVRLSGDEARAIADRVFRSVSGKKISDAKGYTALFGKVFGSDGDIDEAVFVQNMGMSSQEYIKTHACDASFSFSIADMAKNTNLYTAPTSGDDKASELQYWQNNNQMDIVIRFYRYSGRKVMMTVEVIEKYDENGNPISDPTKTVGRFYVLDSVLDMIEEDLLTLLDPTGKKVEMHD